jgi:hypothetical protein
MHDLYHIFIAVVLSLVILSAFVFSGPRWPQYGFYGYGLVAILAVCCTLRVFFGI